MCEIMKLKAKSIWTPCGTMSAPFNPNFGKILENCKTNEDLFALGVKTKLLAINEMTTVKITNLL